MWSQCEATRKRHLQGYGCDDGEARLPPGFSARDLAPSRKDDLLGVAEEPERYCGNPCCSTMDQSIKTVAVLHESPHDVVPAAPVTQGEEGQVGRPPARHARFRRVPGAVQ